MPLSAAVTAVLDRSSCRGSVFAKNIRCDRCGSTCRYLFLYTGSNTVEAVEEPVWCSLSNHKISYPLFIDTEGAGGNGRADGLDKETRTAVCKAFCETIENAGYTAGVYASKHWLENNLDTEQLSAYSTWLAQYSSQPTYEGEYDMWQYTSAGKIDGISTLVDYNVSYMDY